MNLIMGYTQLNPGILIVFMREYVQTFQTLEAFLPMYFWSEAVMGIIYQFLNMG